MTKIMIKDLASDEELDQQAMSEIHGGVDTTWNPVDGLRHGVPALKPDIISGTPAGGTDDGGFDPNTACPNGYVQRADGSIKCLNSEGSY